MTWTAVAVLALLIAPQLVAQPRMHFAIPDGWNQREDPDRGVLILTPPDLPDGKECAILLGAGGELRQPLREWFDATWANLIGRAATLKSSGPSSIVEWKGRDSMFRDAVVRYPNGATRWLGLFAVVLGTRVESILLVASDQRWFDTARLAFGAILQNTDPSVRPGASVQPSPSPSSEVHAAYYGQKNYGGGSAGLVLFKDGTAMRRLPSQGLDRFDHRREAAADTMGWFGRWTDSGSAIRIGWQTGSTSIYGKRGRAIEGDNAILVAVECQPGFRFEGNYERNLAPLPSVAIRFSADGTFIDSGVISSVGLSDQQPPPQGHGTYVVRNFSIEFRYDGGPVIRTGFFVTPGPGSAPSGIFINTYGLARK